MLKKITLLVLISLFFLTIAAYAAVKASEVQVAPVPALRIQTAAEPRTITVIGQGEVSLEPDVATINAGAETRVSTVAGANQVHGVSYTVEDKNGWRSLAQAQTMVNARVHAQDLANLAGVGLGEVLSISEIVVQSC